MTILIAQTTLKWTAASPHRFAVAAVGNKKCTRDAGNFNSRHVRPKDRVTRMPLHRLLDIKKCHEYFETVETFDCKRSRTCSREIPQIRTVVEICVNL